MTTKQTPALNMIRDLRESNYSSYWITNALQDAEQRDPLDALHDAETLVRVFKMRVHEIVNESRESVTS
jgi:hypothetical protein